MSLQHIGAKMMVVRAIEYQLDLISVPPSGHPLATLTHAPHFAAMVPLQVYNSLQVPRERQLLSQIQCLIIGGSSISPSLTAALHDFPHRIYSTYGMTETLSHIALRQINGPTSTDWYTPLQGIHISLHPDDQCLCIDAPHICPHTLHTHDLAQIDQQGRFKILGRKDNIIVSGGIKIQIEAVERLLSKHLTHPFAITSVAHDKFGEIVVLLTEHPTPTNLQEICQQALPKYWQPRLYLHCQQLPQTPTNKPRRAAIQQLAHTLAEP